MPAAHRSHGRVTPKGVRPADVTTRGRRGERPPLDRDFVRTARPLPDRRTATRVPPIRSGHRGGR